MGGDSTVRMQWKLVLIITLLILLSTQFIGAYFIQNLKNYYMNNFNSSLNTQAEILSFNLKSYLNMEQYRGREDLQLQDIENLIANLPTVKDVEVQVIGRDGIVLATSQKDKWILGQKNNQPEVYRALTGIKEEAIRVAPNTGERIKILAVPIKEGSQILGGLLLFASMEEVYGTIQEISQIYYTGTAFALLLSALIGLVLTRTITSPIQAVTVQASAMAEGDFNQKVTVKSEDEIGQLGNAFNHLANRLDLAITKLQRMDQERKDFVANVSHELRTPLTTMKSYLESLADGAIDDPKLSRNFLTVVQNETERMIRLVTDLLLLSRIDSREASIELVPTDVEEFLKAALSRFTFQLQKQGITIQFHTIGNQRTVLLDRDKILQVIDNILSNAIKYSPEHGELQLVIDYSDANDLEIRIQDQGMGIPAEDLERIFERFYRVEKARSRSMGGTGLGLAIASEIIALHGGELKIESFLDQGTTVILRLPVEEEKLDA